MDQPGHNYPLFFLDEAVALAAGHRPCGQCRQDPLSQFLFAWKKSRGLSHYQRIALTDLDRELHQARINELHSHASAALNELPNGTYVFDRHLDHRPLLIFREGLIPWEHGGLGQHFTTTKIDRKVQVLTPRPLIHILKAGYTPSLHEDVQGMRETEPNRA